METLRTEIQKLHYILGLLNFVIPFNPRLGIASINHEKQRCQIGKMQ